jgi:methionyl-tRNA synthetase
MSKYYLTTPIYYVNARPHLGHTYTTIVADVVRRMKKMEGYEACFLTGTDEHGQKVEKSAQAAGLKAKEFSDIISQSFRSLWEELGLRPDYFVRTTDARHEKAVWKIFKAVQKAGHIYKGSYTGPYCVFDELYASEGKVGDPCPLCGRPTEETTEENYFFKLSAFEQPLLKLYRERPEMIQPESRRNEVISFVRSGLRDLSISRQNLKWGIPMPTADSHVFYVWFDALTSYLSGIGYAQGGAQEKQFERLWPADLHLVGKEILRFHAVYWPAFLMAASLPLPKLIFAHGWLLFEQDKMSKSRGNIVRPQPIHAVMGIDALRYFLLREVVFGQDGSFSYEALVDRYNSDLANGLGNLAKRTLDMISRYFNGEVPYPSLSETNEGDREVQQRATETIQAAVGTYHALEFSRALETIWALVAAVNKYLVDNEPWALAEQSEQTPRLATVLYTAAEAIRIATVLAAPVLPESANRLWRQLGQQGEVCEQQFADLKWGQLAHSHRITKVEAVFPRLEKQATIAELRRREEELLKSEQLPAAKEAEAAGETPAPTPAAVPPSHPGAPPAAAGRISIEDFAKVDMRVGQVLTAERVKGSDKLLKMTVDIGSEVRQLVAGIAEAYDPATLPGRKVVIVANLQPRKLRGVESNGMVVAATVGPSGKPVLVSVPDDVPNGSKLK